jgi:acetolactate synthase-1/2/3 large subunit
MHKGAQIILSRLRAEGAELAFGYPGGAIMPLCDALEGNRVHHIYSE